MKILTNFHYKFALWYSTENTCNILFVAYTLAMYFFALAMVLSALLPN